MRILFVSQENKNNDFILKSWFSSVSVFITCSWEYHDACVWCCWHRSRGSDRASISLKFIACIFWFKQVRLGKKLQVIFLSSCLQRLFYVQYASSSACKQGSAHVAHASAAPHTCRGTLVNTCQRLTQKRRNCWIKCFLNTFFSLRAKCFVRIAS